MRILPAICCLLLVSSGCGDDLCERAAEHVARCTGEQGPVNASCTADDADTVLQMTCEEMETAGKADWASVKCLVMQCDNACTTEVDPPELLLEGQAWVEGEWSNLVRRVSGQQRKAMGEKVKDLDKLEDLWLYIGPLRKDINDLDQAGSNVILLVEQVPLMLATHPEDLNTTPAAVLERIEAVDTARIVLAAKLQVEDVVSFARGDEWFAFSYTARPDEIIPQVHFDLYRGARPAGALVGADLAEGSAVVFERDGERYQVRVKASAVNRKRDGRMTLAIDRCDGWCLEAKAQSETVTEAQPVYQQRNVILDQPEGLMVDLLDYGALGPDARAHVPLVLFDAEERGEKLAPCRKARASGGDAIASVFGPCAGKDLNQFYCVGDMDFAKDQDNPYGIQPMAPGEETRCKSGDVFRQCQPEESRGTDLWDGWMFCYKHSWSGECARVPDEAIKWLGKRLLDGWYKQYRGASKAQRAALYQEAREALFTAYPL